MQIIISHSGADFDACASMVAAKLLYPEAQMFFVGSPEPGVREFVTLHRDVMAIRNESEYQDEPVELVILVDTREPARLGVFAHIVSRHDVPVYIYDHHPATRESIKGDREFIEPCGAAVTILLKRLLPHQPELSPALATLFLLALYEETGSLTYSSTTHLDIMMASVMVRRGASLALVPIFAQHNLSGEQRRLMGELLAGSFIKEVSGCRIMLSAAKSPDYVGEMAVVAQRIMELETPDVLFIVLEMGQRQYIIARSRAGVIDVGRIMQEFGGGGHATAASASFRPRALDDIFSDLLWMSEARIPKAVTAADLMSSPVDFIDISKPVTVEEAAQVMRGLGHSAICVCNGNELQGIISRSDADKALHHGLGHAPVQAYMTKSPIYLDPSDGLAQIRRLLVENDIGRLPVVSHGHLSGIVSRSDVLRAMSMNEEQVLAHSVDHVPVEILGLSADALALLKSCGAIGKEIGFQVYAVGGFVRDMLLTIENNDVDLLVEGDAIMYAEHLAERLKGRCRSHEKFATAVVVLPGGQKIDVVTARTEIYTRPAALPVVQGSTLKQDLYRRDFSINAMALQISPDHFGELVDFFGARRDLKRGIIRVLHNLSFVDDPTRIFRAVKFEQRYGFRMDTNTQNLLEQAVDEGILTLISSERACDELMQILAEPRPFNAIMRMHQLRILRLLSKALVIDTRNRRILENVEDILQDYSGLVRNGAVKSQLVYLNALLGAVPLEEAKRISSVFHFRSDDMKRLLLLTDEKWAELLRLMAQSGLRDSQLARALQGKTVEGALYLAARSGNDRVRERVAYYLRSLRFAESLIDGDQLRRFGYRPGPQFGEILDWIWEQSIDGQVKTVEEAKMAIEAKYPDKSKR